MKDIDMRNVKGSGSQVLFPISLTSQRLFFTKSETPFTLTGCLASLSGKHLKTLTKVAQEVTLLADSLGSRIQEPQCPNRSMLGHCFCPFLLFRFFAHLSQVKNGRYMPAGNSFLYFCLIVESHMADVTGIPILVGCVDPKVGRRGKTKGGHL